MDAPPGEKGIQGKNGFPGIPGRKGFKGDQGPLGYRGPNGISGKKGKHEGLNISKDKPLTVFWGIVILQFVGEFIINLLRSFYYRCERRARIYGSSRCGWSEGRKRAIRSKRK